MNLLSAMEAYVFVVESGSFSAAARRLRVGQPAVSKAIAQLEDHLGVRLLLRSTHGLTPTESGQNFYEHARRTVDSAQEAVTAARLSRTALSGRLRISAPVTFARLHVMPHLPAFLKAHPALDVDLFFDDRNIDLIEAGIDVALRMGPQTDSALTARRLGSNPRLVMGTPQYFRRAGVPKRPDDLAQHQAITYDLRGGGANWTFTRGDEQVPVQLRGRIRSTAMEAVRESALAHLGLVVVSEWMFRNELAAGQIRTVLNDWTLPAIDLWAVSPTGRWASARTRAFVDFMAQRIFPADGSAPG